MQANRSDQAPVERVIVLQLLRDDHPRRWTRGELEREASGFLPEEVEVAIEDLASQGVVEYEDEEMVWASLCVLQLDALGLITI